MAKFFCIAMALALSAYSANIGFLVVANKGDHTVGLIDPASGKQIAVIDAGGITPHEVTASPDGRLAFAPIYGNSGVGKPGTDGSKVAVIDLKTRKLAGTVDFEKGVRPHDPVFNPRTGVLYVTTELNQTITVVDPKTLKITGVIPTGQPESHMLVISHDGHRGYTANVGPGTVSVLDLDAGKTLAIIPISANTQRISITPDDKMVFTADQTRPRMAVIDTATSKVKGWIALPAPGYGTAVTPDGKLLVVAVPDANKVVIVNLVSMTVTNQIDVPAAPQEVLITPDGKSAYVSCDKSGKVAQIDLTAFTLSRLIDAGKTVDGLAWAQGSLAQ
jgi:DNA-binding beta-propeller fold protein YncE